MKYIKKLNIDFNNWDEIEQSNKKTDFNININIEKIFNLFKKYLDEKDLFDRYMRNLKKSVLCCDVKDFFNKVYPENWVSNGFGWGIDYVDWSYIDYNWKILYKKKNL